MGAIGGILFDKDGTLVSFQGFWIPFTIDLVEISLKRLGVFHQKDLRAHFLEELGVDPVEETLIEGGVLAEDTTDGLIRRLGELLLERGLITTREADSFLSTLYSQIESITKESKERILPVTDLHELFQRLRAEGLYLGIATHDSSESTQYFLEVLKIRHLFQYIGCADEGIPSKPHPYFLQSFCETCNLKSQEVAVVGDTLADLGMARRGGAIAVGVLSGISRESTLRPLAHYIFPSVEHLYHPVKGLSIGGQDL